MNMNEDDTNTNHEEFLRGLKEMIKKKREIVNLKC